MLTETNQTTTSADVLDLAATMLERDGWCQGEPSTDDGARCAATALNDAANQLAGPDYADPLMATYIAAETHVNCMDLVTWNDTAGRTRDQVTAAFRAAAARLRGSA